MKAQLFSFPTCYVKTLTLLYRRLCKQVLWKYFGNSKAPGKYLFHSTDFSSTFLFTLVKSPAFFCVTHYFFFANLKFFFIHSHIHHFSYLNKRIILCICFWKELGSHTPCTHSQVTNVNNLVCALHTFLYVHGVPYRYAYAHRRAGVAPLFY